MENKSPTELPQRTTLLGSRYSQMNREEVLKFLISSAALGRSGYVCVSNVHTTMMGVFDKSYQAITNQSLLSVPDGMPLVWAMRSLGASAQDRVRGPTLMRDIFSAGSGEKIKHYLFGGSPQAIQKLKIYLEKEYPGACIVGAESPSFRPLDAIPENEWVETANRINQSGAHFIWIGLGAPKQEIWMFQQRHRIRGIMLGVGAAFDLLSGTIPEAPQWIQSLGMEWAYRFLKEPRRLWRRYLFNNPAFLVLWFFQWFSQDRGTKEEKP